jgi:peptidoglycan/xylan/chitin deacetylase (PgdA/CDA1 family)
VKGLHRVTASLSLRTGSLRPVAALIGVAVLVAASAGADARAVHAGSGLSAAGTRVPILMYHLIVPTQLAGGARPDMVVTPREFDAQMAGLHERGWRTITLEELAGRSPAAASPASPASPARADASATARRQFVVTIDDGRVDGYDFALPILRRYGFRATFFVVAERIGKPGQMTAEQLRGLLAEGHEIGDHTASHVGLPGLSRRVLTHEVCDAADSIERITGRRPTTFAYPNGRFDAAAEDAVRRCPGLVAAVTTRRVAWENLTGQFEIPRLPVEPGTSPLDLLAAIDADR